MLLLLVNKYVKTHWPQYNIFYIKYINYTLINILASALIIYLHIIYVYKQDKLNYLMIFSTLYIQVIQIAN